MKIGELRARASRENVLLSVLLELTYNCNLDCFFCYNDRSIEGKPLSKEQYFGLLQELHDLQVLYLTLSGGEPLAHPHFFEIGARARALGFLVKVKSNGHALNRRLARRVKSEVDPFRLDISLHGATAATHDRQTRVPGSFDKLMKNLQVLKDLDLRYKLNATITRWNEHEIAEMFELADRLGVKMDAHTSVTPKDDGDTTPLSIAPSKKAIGNTLAIQLDRSANKDSWLEKARQPAAGNCAVADREGKQCGTGSTTLTIDPVGNILPCVQWRRPVGNVHRDTIQSVWRDSPDLAEVRQTNIRARKFVDSYGEQGRLMKYCIGEAVAQTGQPVGLYPIARRQLEGRLKVVIKS